MLPKIDLKIGVKDAWTCGEGKEGLKMLKVVIEIFGI